MSLTYPGGYITKSPVAPTANAAPGVWTMDQALQYIKAGTWPLSRDPFFNQVTLLLPGNGTNGAQNNTFLDGSTNNFTITRNGNTTQGTFTPFSQPDGRWSNYFDGTDDFLSLASNAAFAVGSVVTMECWFYPLSQAGALMMGTVGTAAPQLGWQNATTFGIASVSTAWRLTSATVPTLNAWNHVAFVRTGTGANESSIFLNGTRIANGQITDAWTSNTGFTIGGASDSTSEFTGYISNARVVKGTAVYDPASTTITVPTTPLTAITNTSLLTCQSNRFRDNSSNNFAITRNGDVRVTAFSPFAPTAAYDAGTNGGSGYFDGTGDYLSVADNVALDLGSGNFCIECWYYPTATGGVNGRGVISKGSSTGASFLIFHSTDILAFYASSNGTSWDIAIDQRWTSSLAINTWHHVAVSRDGNTFRLFLNGTQATSFTSSSTLIDNNSAVEIGRYSTLVTQGYITDARIVKGSAVYTAAFTPPTAPLTAITNTSLLLNFTNGGIIDSTGKNVLETVGDAQIDTSVSKWGGGSMEFDGNGDYLTLVNQPDLHMGSGDFTVEGWLYVSSLPSAGNNAAIVSLGNVITSGFSGLRFRINPTGKFELYLSSNGTSWAASGTSTNSISTGTWVHFAVVRNGTGSNNVVLYVNGTSDLTLTTTASLHTPGFYGVGVVFSSSAATEFLNGYIDDLRITKGIARYTANFTPPGQPFQLL